MFVKGASLALTTGPGLCGEAGGRSDVKWLLFVGRI